MSTNVITADFKGEWSCLTEPLWQWDYGQVLEITGIDALPSSFAAHFANRWEGASQTVIGTDACVTIPDALLATGWPVYVWIVLTSDGTDGGTKYKITIPVNRRAAPSDYPTPAQQSAITQAINALNTAAANVAEEIAANIVDATLEVSGKAADAAKTGEEISKLKSAFNGVDSDLENVSIMHLRAPFKAGTGINEAGDIITSGNAAKRIATADFIDISTATQITYTVTSGYRLYIAFYGSPSVSDYINRLGWLTGTNTINKDSTFKYMRVCYASVNDESTLTVVDVDKVSIMYDYKLYNDIARFTDLLDEVFIGKAAASHRLSENDDLDNITTIGSFVASSDVIAASISHCPTNRKFSAYVFQIGVTSIIGQIVFPSGEAEIYFRNKNGNVWSEWSSERFDRRFVNIVEANKNLLSTNNLINYSNVTETSRIRVDDGSVISATNQFVTDYIPINEGMIYELNASLGSNDYGNAFYDVNKNFICAYSGYSDYYGRATAPEKSAFVRFTIQNTHLSGQTAIVKFTAPKFENPGKMPVICEKTKWLAIGDSITYGVYSYINGNESANSVTNECWVRMLASALNYDLSIMASRGMGYVHTGHDPLDFEQNIDLDTLLGRIEAMTDDFNLVTIAFGINDYNNSDITVEGVTASIDDAIERLVTKFPHSRLVVVTPFNECRYGDASTNYAYNFSRGNKTLKELADAIKAECVKYGVECVYATNGFLFNNFNLTELLPDTVHPSLVGHKLIAKNMAHFLMN